MAHNKRTTAGRPRGRDRSAHAARRFRRSWGRWARPEPSHAVTAVTLAPLVYAGGVGAPWASIRSLHSLRACWYETG